MAMNLEKEIMGKLSQEMAREIDKEIIDNIVIEMLTKDGWTQTKLNPAFSEYGMMGKPFEDWYSQTAEWVHLNATGDYKLVKGQWIFEKGADATMFILKWA
jgi:hypothetical protein